MQDSFIKKVICHFKLNISDLFGGISYQKIGRNIKINVSKDYSNKKDI